MFSESDIVIQLVHLEIRYWIQLSEVRRSVIGSLAETLCISKKYT